MAEELQDALSDVSKDVLRYEKREIELPELLEHFNRLDELRTKLSSSISSAISVVKQEVNLVRSQRRAENIKQLGY